LPRTRTAPYPAIEPFDKRTLAVGGPHQLYVEQVGAPGGLPAVYLHGGPGGGCQPSQRQLFDPARFRAVLFDQRGAGASRPKRCLEANTTDHLVADLERIRTTLEIERWLVVGGSWGATLALAYAEAHPERVTGLVLRAVFLGGAEDVAWGLGRAPRTFRPDLWRRFTGLLPADQRGDPLAAYGARLEHPDPAVHGPAALVWHDFERALSVLEPGQVDLPDELDALAGSSRRLPDSPFVEWHYIKHDCFLAPGQLLEGAGRLAGIPGVIVQGRFDLLCPPAAGHALAERWPDAELRIVEAAGHALSEPGIGKAVLAAIEDFKKRFS
jgi:proline iminopeptidase